VTDISKMDKNKAKMDKSEHEIGRVVMIGAKTWIGSKAMMMDLELRDEIETYETLLKA
ncbi:hypothetical protein Tco_0164324, partial [Tanacetum coccineum]